MSEHPEVERRARYAAAAALVGAAPAWVDLGCGDGAAAADALTVVPEAVVLVDGDGDALREAARVLPGATAVEADLASPDGVALVRPAVLAVPGAAVTCFGTLSSLASFVPLLDLLGELVERAGATVVLDVPTGPAGGSDPSLRGGADLVWGERAFDELRRLLPGEPVLARQVELGGSAVVPAGAGGAPLDLPPVRAGDVPATHLLAAFGPRAGELGAVALAGPVDHVAARRRARERDADLAFLEARLAGS